MSDLDRDGWPTADSVLRSERTKIERLERELAEARAWIERQEHEQGCGPFVCTCGRDAFLAADQPTDD